MFKKLIITLFLIFIINVESIFAQVSEEDSLALVKLYDSTDGDNWIHKKNWKNGPISGWHGVKVSEGRVVELRLIWNNLKGSIPPEIGNLENLTHLSLKFNQLTEIPPEIGKLKILNALRLNNNQLTEIPSEIGKLENLIHLDLSINQLIEIPPEIGNLENLTELRLNNNHLIEIPPEIGNLKKLTHLILAGNYLFGIPPEIGNLENLTRLYLTNNQLIEIPPEVGNLENLTHLGLPINQLIEIPPEIGNLEKLTHFYIENNYLTDLPDLSALTSLRHLTIQHNQFTFEDIEPNIDIQSCKFRYAPQDSIGKFQTRTVPLGSELTLSVSVGGANNKYQWKKDGSIIPEATSHLYTINSAGFGDVGIYTCGITNTVATELTLYSRPIFVFIGSDVER